MIQAEVYFFFDTYEGMSDPTDNDVSGVDNNSAIEMLDKVERLNGDNVWCYSPIDEVKNNVMKAGYPADKNTFCKRQS
ncbi:MAG: hypothetical protein NVV59_12295 [Chitinophagaceae bacterium]|nr:hypothetical protein [Chitinophagaceae bacterium]